MSELAERVSSRLRSSQTLRLLTVGVLVLLLQIPIAMIGGQVSERQQRGAEAVEEVSAKWGDHQVLAGPVLVVPYLYQWTELNNAGRSIERSEYRFANFLPDRLQVRAIATAETRKRGIFSVPVYRLDLEVTGRFSRPELGDLALNPQSMAWDRAGLVMGISDTRAVQEAAELDWNGRQLPFVPGTAGQHDVGKGIHAVVGFPTDKSFVDFSFPLSVNGIQGVRFTPFGKLTLVGLKSNYPHPSFQGNWLPNERDVTDQGFEARWEIPYLGRSFPQGWIGGTTGVTEAIGQSAFGVDFIDPVDHYRMAERSVKYASLFILLTFAALWLFEVRAGVRIHPIQFLMLGAALCLFYLLELSLSEHFRFPLAFTVASLAVIGMVVAYGVVVLRALTRAIAIGFGVAILYAYLYILLVNEDYALLIGSIGLFVILALIMFATRRVDWYGVGAKSSDAAKPAP